MQLTKNLALLTALFLLALNCSAQYVVAKKGDTVPFEKAVITNAPTFKLESRKLELQEQLVLGLRSEAAKLREAARISDAQLAIEQQRHAATAQQLKLVTAAHSSVNTKYQDSLKKLKKQNRFYNRKEFWAAAGVVVGILIVN